MNSILRIVCYCLLLATIFTNCEKPPEVTVSIDKEDYDAEEQNQLGNNFAAAVDSFRIYDILDRSTNQEFYSYIDQLWTSVVNNQIIENRREFDWEVFIIQDDEIKTAFSVPGGKLYLYTGFLKSIKNESELFGIMAHELYYIDRGAVMDAMLNTYGTIAVGDLWLHYEENGAKGVVESLYELQIPSFEVEKADRFAVDLVCPFRYHPKGLLSFLYAAYEDSLPIEWLQSKAGTDQRLDHFETFGNDCGEEQFTFTERYQEYISLLP